MQRLADALTAAGHTPWFDKMLGSGERFRDAIERQLDESDAVVVVWSGRSKRSRWVVDEADWAMARGRLVPVRIDNGPLPLGYGAVHAIDFTAWTGAVDAAAFQELLVGIGGRSGAAVTPRPPLRTMTVGLGLGVVIAALFAAGWTSVAHAQDWSGASSTLRDGALLGAMSGIPVSLWAAYRARRMAQGSLAAVAVRAARVYLVAALVILPVVGFGAILGDPRPATDILRGTAAGTAIVGALIAMASGAVLTVAHLLRR